jgi:hypothetical protein
MPRCSSPRSVRLQRITPFAPRFWPLLRRSIALHPELISSNPAPCNCSTPPTMFIFPGLLCSPLAAVVLSNQTRLLALLKDLRPFRVGRSAAPPCTSDLMGLGGGRTLPRFDPKTLQSPVGCLDMFDQILKRRNLIVCGPELRSGPDMQRDYGQASPTRIREMRLHPVC